MKQLLHWIPHEDARHRFAISLVVAGVTFFVLRGYVSFLTELIATWDAFGASALALAWTTILTTPLDDLRRHAKAQDVSRFAIFVFVITAACAALFAVVFLVRAHRIEMHGHLTSHLLLALGTVSASWALVHTVFSLRYAHIFYGDSDDRNVSQKAGGLAFPGEENPDYSDFAYFSFVIGMTCQVSDVQVTSGRLRRLTLLHGMLSFAFNTVILALLINTVSGLV
jgi:uncharacterized membrane protein